MVKSPYLSIVVVGRNDDYGVNFLSRINTFVRSLDHQIRHDPDLLELLIVEWNPLGDRPRIFEALVPVQNLAVRVITVPTTVHDSMNTTIPVLEWYGKNVGVRRSNGEYVLITNPDILFSDEMISLISQKKFQPNTFYRSDRFDFVGEGIDLLPPSDYIKFALEHVFQGHLSDDHAHVIQPKTDIRQLPKSRTDRIHTNASGDFILAKREIFDDINGLYESTENLYHCDSMSVIRLCFNQVAQCCITAPMCILHWDHPRGGRTNWDPVLAYRLGQSLGRPDWGLAGVELAEWNNR